MTVAADESVYETWSDRRAWPISPGGGAPVQGREGVASDPRNDESRPKAALSQLHGGDLLSQALARQVPSALRGLTALFGMGRGVSPSQ